MFNYKWRNNEFNLKISNFLKRTNFSGSMHMSVYVKNFLRNRVTFMEMKVHAEYTFLCGNGNRVATKQRGIVRADIFNETSIVRVSGD